MGPILIVIGHIGSNHGVQVTLPKDKHVIQTLTPHTAKQALDKGVGLRSMEGCLQDLDPDTSSHGSKAKRAPNLASLSRIRYLGVEPKGVASRSCWASQASVGWRVTPTCTILREPTSKMKNTKRSRKNTSSTCRRSQNHTAEA